MNEAVQFFLREKRLGHKPFLLKFNDEKKLFVCGLKPKMTLEVKAGSLYKDGQKIGEPLDIFSYLEPLIKVPKKNKCFFPAWLGFFSYDFYRYFYPSFIKKNSTGIPEAFFQYFEEGQSFTASQSEAMTIFDAPVKIYTPVEKAGFITKVMAVQELIKKGDVYQVNLSVPFEFHCNDEEFIKLLSLSDESFTPYSGLVMHEDWGVLSLSPEKLFSLHNGVIKTKPIAGTKARSINPHKEAQSLLELQTCPKENSEHVMLVDLLRNDLHQVCPEHTMKVSKDRSVEFFSHVMHLVSEVQGQTNAPLKDIFKAIFPGGTITGTPKLSSIKTIDVLEETFRGPYTGSFGYVSSGYGACFNILIRSLYKKGNKTSFNAGAGVVIDSNPEQEWQEVHKKAFNIKNALEGGSRSLIPKKKPITGQFILPKPSTQNLNAHVAFVENYDSFSFNIVAALKSLGAKVTVFSQRSFFLDDTISHVVIGPGPGNPQGMPKLGDIITHSTARHMPLLGVCLGHQALGCYFGAQLEKTDPIHGQSQEMFCYGQGLFEGLPKKIHFVRYHSLILKECPKGFLVDAQTINGLIMAIRHKTKPIFGVQFHPESYLSKDGIELLANFLRTEKSCYC